ncbi:MAG: hypothetical protein MJ198_08605 [Bacteroidales bacterium]|nr:hypothetical protein [Bacteroidales bacterium]
MNTTIIKPHEGIPSTLMWMLAIMAGIIHTEDSQSPHQNRLFQTLLDAPLHVFENDVRKYGATFFNTFPTNFILSRCSSCF